MKGRAAHWSPAEIAALARFDGRSIVSVVEWYSTVVSGHAGRLVFAAGGLPSVAVAARIPSSRSESRRVSALIALAERAVSPPFTWSEPLRFYIDANSLPVPWSLVRQARDMAVDAAVEEARIASQSLVGNKIPVSKWQAEVANSMKMAHGAAACLTLGGWSAVDAEDWLRIEPELVFQLRYLDRFAQSLEYGDVPVDGRFWARVKQYPRSARKTWFKLTGLEMIKRGYDMEMNLLGGTESCDECIEMSELGWVPQGTLVQPGERDCLNFCACELQYASSFTGQTWRDELTT
jgi:hypothetical protein